MNGQNLDSRPSRKSAACQKRKQGRATAWENVAGPEVLTSQTLEMTASDRRVKDSSSSSDPKALLSEYVPNVLIERYASEDSMLGIVGAEFGIRVMRCFKTQNIVEGPATHERLKQTGENNPGAQLWGSLECTARSQWQNMNSRNNVLREKLQKARDDSRTNVSAFKYLAQNVGQGGGPVSFEWPRHASGWCDSAVQSIVNACVSQTLTAIPEKIEDRDHEQDSA